MFSVMRIIYIFENMLFTKICKALQVESKNKIVLNSIHETYELKVLALAVCNIIGSLENVLHIREESLYLKTAFGLIVASWKAWPKLAKIHLFSYFLVFWRRFLLKRLPRVWRAARSWSPVMAWQLLLRQLRHLGGASWNWIFFCPLSICGLEMPKYSSHCVKSKLLEIFCLGLSHCMATECKFIK